MGIKLVCMTCACMWNRYLQHC